MDSTSLYIERDSGLHRLHPFSKMVLSAFALAAALAAPGLLWLLLAFALYLLPLAAWGMIVPPFLRSTWKTIWPFWLSLTIIQGFFSGGEQVLFSVGPWNYTVEGFFFAQTFTARLLVALGATLLFMLATRPDKLMLALSRRGLPQWLGYVLLTSLQIFPRFQERARVILEAQQSRGLETEGNLLHRARLLLPLVGPLLLSSIVDVDERAVALEARAFSHQGPKTSIIQLEDSHFQALLRAAALVALVALLTWRLLLLR